MVDRAEHADDCSWRIGDLVFPLFAGITVTAIVGWPLVFSGLLHVVFAWQAGRAGAVLWEILLGIVYGAIGLYLLTSPVAGLASLTLAIAIYLVFEGVYRIRAVVPAPPRTGDRVAGWPTASLHWCSR